MNDAEFAGGLHAVVAGVDNSRWALAMFAAQCKAAKYPEWALKIGQHPAVRRKARTIREWAQVAAFRHALSDADGRLPDLPFSFWAAATRRLDQIPFSSVVELMYTAEAEGTGLDEFRAELSTQAGGRAEPTFADLLDVAIAAVRAANKKASGDGERILTWQALEKLGACKQDLELVKELVHG